LYKPEWISNLLDSVLVANSKLLDVSARITSIDKAKQRLLLMKQQSSDTASTEQDLQRLAREMRQAQQREFEANKTAENTGYYLTRDIPYTVWTMIDPSAGVGVSDYAIVSIVVNVESDCVIVGLASLNCGDGEELAAAFKDYFTRLKMHPCLRNARHQIGFENNFGGSLVAYDVYKYNIRPHIAHTAIVDKPGIWGLCTHDIEKHNGVQMLWHFFPLKKIFIGQFLVWLGRETRYHLLKEFEQQMQNIKHKNGKFSGKPARDDMAIALVLILHWSKRKLMDAEQERERESQRLY
jgi:hypothetical protein